MSAITSTVNSVSHSLNVTSAIKSEIVIITMTRYELEFSITFEPNKSEIVEYNSPNAILAIKIAHVPRHPSATMDDVLRIIKIPTIHCPIIR